LGYIEYKDVRQLDYHTSAVLAATLDTATLCYRTRDQWMRMRDVISGLTGGGQRRLASFSTAFPFNMTGEWEVYHDNN
jgi:hypothetical protein